MSPEPPPLPPPHRYPRSVPDLRVLASTLEEDREAGTAKKVSQIVLGNSTKLLQRIMTVYGFYQQKQNVYTLLIYVLLDAVT